MTTSAVADELVARLRSICLALPETYEEPAWTGTRWRVRHKTFAHVLTIAEGWPPAYARAAHTDGPAHVLMVRSTNDELEALRQLGPPYFATAWRSDEIGVHLSATTDWTEITELVTDSYRNQAPHRLANIDASLPQIGEHRRTGPGGSDRSARTSREQDMHQQVPTSADETAGEHS